MAEITVTNTASSLHDLFDKVKSVYYKSGAQDPTTITAVDVELPIISDGVTFNTGDVSSTKVRLTDGRTWTSIDELGDSDISFQVASTSDYINNLFLDNKDDSESTLGGTLDSKNYKGYGYDITAKKISGALLMLSENEDTIILLSYCEITAALVIEESKPAYYNISVTPVSSEGKKMVYILHKYN